MGIIIRQSLKQSFVSYVAVGVGLIAHIFIYTIDESATYGVAARIMSVVMLLYPILLFGVPQALIKFYGKHSKSDKGYLANFLVATIPIVGSFFLIYILFKEQILNFLEWLGMDIQLLTQYGPQITILIITLILFKVIAAHMATQKRIVWPGMFDNLWPKIALAVLVSLIIFDYLSTDILSWGLVAYYGLGLIAIIIYALYLGKFNLRWNSNVFKGDGLREIGKYSAYTGLASFGSTFATRIDTVMVAVLAPGTVAASTDQLTGVYVLFLALAGVVEVPARAINNISGPIISQANDRGDLQEVKLIYEKSSRTLFLMGVGVFSLIFLSLGDLFVMTNRGAFYSDFFTLFTVLGLVKVVSMTFSSVNQIILYSKYYRYTLYLTLFLGVSNLILNYYFITSVFVESPLTGVSIATGIAFAINYLVKVVFVWTKFGIHPFHFKMLLAVVFAAMCFGIAFVVPSFNIPSLNVIISSFLSIAIRSLVFAAPFVYLVYTFKVSEDHEQSFGSAYLLESKTAILKI